MDSGERLILKRNSVFVCTKDIERIKCLDGIFWITYKSGEDIFLQKNEEFLLKNRKNVVIQAFKNGKLLVKRKKKKISGALKNNKVSCACI